MKFELLPDSERKLILNILRIIQSGEYEGSDLNYLLNKSGPAVEIATSLFLLECEALELLHPETKKDVTERLEACLSLVAQLSLISGGVGFQDFARTTAIAARMQEAG